MKSFSDTEMRDLVIERRIPPRRHPRTAPPDREQQLATHATMIAAGFRYDPAMRAWVKRG